MHSLSINCRVLVCCTCHFQGGSPFFIYFGFLSLQVSSVSNFHWHEGVKVATYLGSLVELCCGEGVTLGILLACVGSACSGWATLFATAQGSMYFLGPHCSGSRGSQGHCPKWALCIMHFPGLSYSGSQLLCKSTDPDGLGILRSSQVQATQATRCLANALSQVACFMHLPGPSCSVSRVNREGTVPGVPCVSSGEWSQAVTLLVAVNHPGSQEDVVSNRQPAHSLVEDVFSGSDCSGPLPLTLAVAHLPLCCWGGRALNGSWLALLWYLLGHNP